MIIGNAVYLGGTPLPPLTTPATASDILDGKEVILPDANDEPVKVTGTLVPPVDTGANGLYKGIVQNHYPVSDVIYDDGLTLIGAYGLAYFRCGQDATDINNIHFMEFENVRRTGDYCIYNAYIERIKFNKQVRLGYQHFSSTSRIITLDFASIETTASTYRITENSLNLKHFIVRSSTLCPLISSVPKSLFGNTSSVRPPNVHLYFPLALLDDYKTATNWTLFASIMYPFYLAPTVADIQTLLNDSSVPVGSMIICDAADYTQKYTVKEATT